MSEDENARGGGSRTGTCAYCGAFGKVTDDHVVPQCLFPTRQRPHDMPMLDACEPCNHRKKSQDDEYLRDYLGMCLQVWSAPAIQSHVYPRFANAMSKSAVVRDVMAGMRPRDVYTESGIFLRREPARVHSVDVYSAGGVFLYTTLGARLSDDRASRILERMVWALHLVFYGASLPEGSQYEVRLIDNIPEEMKIAKLLVDVGAAYYQPVGDGTIFNSIRYRAPRRPEATRWYLAFYEKLVFRVVTNRHLLNAA